jgi:hypothetical protein
MNEILVLTIVANCLVARQPLDYYRPDIDIVCQKLISLPVGNVGVILSDYLPEGMIRESIHRILRNHSDEGVGILEDK